MATEQKNSPAGLWAALENMEAAATHLLSQELGPFEASLRSCYEAGVQAPTLKGSRHKEPDMLLAALFLKRVLNDLRGLWVLIRSGYSSQAASVAASLFENALLVVSLVGNRTNASKLRASPQGELPWGPIDLAKVAARRQQREVRQAGGSFDDTQYERAWREVYSAYKWLCQVKHPTLPSAAHDAFGASVRPDEYVLMAAPDVRDTDLAVKATILAISVNRALEAIQAFAGSLQGHESEPNYREFQARLESSWVGAIEAYKSIGRGSLPFDISESGLAREWVKLKRKQGGSTRLPGRSSKKGPV